MYRVWAARSVRHTLTERQECTSCPDQAVGASKSGSARMVAHGRHRPVGNSMGLPRRDGLDCMPVARIARRFHHSRTRRKVCVALQSPIPPESAHHATWGGPDMPTPTEPTPPPLIALLADRVRDALCVPCLPLLEKLADPQVEWDTGDATLQPCPGQHEYAVLAGQPLRLSADLTVGELVVYEHHILAALVVTGTPALPYPLYQLLTVTGGRIAAIRGYHDSRQALGDTSPAPRPTCPTTRMHRMATHVARPWRPSHPRASSDQQIPPSPLHPAPQRTPPGATHGDDHRAPACRQPR